MLGMPRRRSEFTEKCQGTRAVSLPASARDCSLWRDKVEKSLKRAREKEKEEPDMGKGMSKGLLRSGKDLGSPFQFLLSG